MKSRDSEKSKIQKDRNMYSQENRTEMADGEVYSK